MWPKALTQLVELAPHLTRLAPLADRFLKDKASGDQATRDVLEGHRAALDAQRSEVSHLADRLHADMGAVQSAQATQTTVLQRQISDLERHLSSTRADALAAKQATEGLETRLARIEAAQGRSQIFSLVALVLLLAILVLIATLFLHAR